MTARRSSLSDGSVGVRETGRHLGQVGKRGHFYQFAYSSVCAGRVRAGGRGALLAVLFLWFVMVVLLVC